MNSIEAQEIMEKARFVTQAPAGKMSDLAKGKCVTRKSSFIVDSTLRNCRIAEQDMLAKKKRGYRVLLLFVDSPVFCDDFGLGALRIGVRIGGLSGP